MNIKELEMNANSVNVLPHTQQHLNGMDETSASNAKKNHKD